MNQNLKIFLSLGIVLFLLLIGSVSCDLSFLASDYNQENGDSNGHPSVFDNSISVTESVLVADYGHNCDHASNCEDVTQNYNPGSETESASLAIEELAQYEQEILDTIMQVTDYQDVNATYDALKGYNLTDLAALGFEVIQAAFFNDNPCNLTLGGCDPSTRMRRFIWQEAQNGCAMSLQCGFQGFGTFKECKEECM